MSGFGSLMRRAVRLPLGAIPKGTVLPVLSGALRGARWVVGAGTHGCWLGTYEPHTRKWFSALLAPGNVVYDVGANVGFFTLLASRIVGQEGAVVAFEPLPANVQALRRHVELNRAGNVTIVEAAVSDRRGRARFDTARNPAMGGLATNGALEVETGRLDEFVSERSLPKPDLMKIDVEGAEVRVLQGAIRCIEEARPAIVLSAHGWRLFEESRTLLGSMGYEQEVAKDGAEDGDYLIVARSRRK